MEALETKEAVLEKVEGNLAGMNAYVTSASKTGGHPPEQGWICSPIRSITQNFGKRLQEWVHFLLVLFKLRTTMI